MDWWSSTFFILGGAALVYTGLAFMWSIQLFWASGAHYAWVRIHLPSLLVLTVFCWLMLGVLLLADSQGWITMWSIIDAFPNLRIQ